MTSYVKFEFQGHTFRFQELAAIPLARELHRLLVRLDHDTGMLNTLAFRFDNSDFGEMRKMSPAGILKFVKLISMLVKADEPIPVAVESDEDGETGDEPKTRDELPRTLDELCLYYAQLGKVEHLVMQGEHEHWLPLQSEDNLNKHPVKIAPFIVAFNVLKSIFVPFASPLLALIEERKVQTSPSTQPSSSDKESSSPVLPTSEI